MAKDAQGHGSDGKGAHSGTIDKLPSKMTKAHFEVIAQQLRDAKASPEQVTAMAARLATTNPGFNAQRFADAVNSGTVKMGSRASSKANASTQLGRMNKPTPVQSENAPFKSRFKRGSNYLDPHDPRSR
jgi:PBP1b-binding outer membrane lipoprotein LpoB